MSHTKHPPQADTCPTLRDMMIDTHPPAQRLRIAAQQLDAALDAGQFARLASMQLVGLRGLVWMMDETAEQLDAAEMVARPVRARAGWLTRWFS